MSGPSSISSSSSLPGWAAPYGMGLLGDTTSYVNQDLASGMPSGMNYQVAPFTGAQQAGLSQMEGAAGQMSNVINPAANSLTNTLSGANLNPESNPYLAQTVQEAMLPVVQNYQDATEPGIQAEFAHAGSFGGSAQQQQEQLGQYGLGQALASTATGILEPAYEQGLQQQLQAQGLVPGLLSSMTMPGQTLYGAGSSQQQQQQAQLDAAQQNASMQYQYPYNTLGNLASMMGPAVGGSYIGKTQNPNYVDPLSAGLSGAAGLGGIAALLGL